MRGSICVAGDPMKQNDLFGDQGVIVEMTMMEDKILGKYQLEGRQEVTLIQGDLTLQKVDAIVNAANPRLRHGGGVAAMTGEPVSLATLPRLVELDALGRDDRRHSLQRLGCVLAVGQCDHLPPPQAVGRIRTFDMSTPSTRAVSSRSM